MNKLIFWYRIAWFSSVCQRQFTYLIRIMKTLICVSIVTFSSFYFFPCHFLLLHDKLCNENMNKFRDLTSPRTQSKMNFVFLIFYLLLWNNTMLKSRKMLGNDPSSSVIWPNIEALPTLAVGHEHLFSHLFQR